MPDEKCYLAKNNRLTLLVTFIDMEDQSVFKK